jgi:hypothetical protein
MPSMSGADYLLLEAAQRCVKTFVRAVMAWAHTKGVTLAWSDFIPRSVREDVTWHDPIFTAPAAKQPADIR